jgi:hypothetical protein
MKFLIQHNLMAVEQLKKIEESTIGYPREFVGLIPFSREITSDEPLNGVEFIPYGSTLLTTIGMDRGWTGLHFDHDTFTYDAALKNRSDMLNDNVITAKEVIEFLRNRPENEDWFIRPSQDLKHFSGQVIGAKECVDWLTDAMQVDTSGTYKIDDDLRIVLSKPKTIQAEWRWFVVGGKVVSGSMYRAHGQMRQELVTDPCELYEAQQMANMWLPSPCVVMDLALVDDVLKVIEFNCINSSGFYKNDVGTVFPALYEYGAKK